MLRVVTLVQQNVRATRARAAKGKVQPAATAEVQPAAVARKRTREQSPPAAGGDAAPKNFFAKRGKKAAPAEKSSEGAAAAGPAPSAKEKTTDVTSPEKVTISTFFSFCEGMAYV